MVSPSLPNQSFQRCKAIITLFVLGGREALYCDHRIFTAIHRQQINGNFTPHTCVLLFVTNIVLYCISFRDLHFYDMQKIHRLHYLYIIQYVALANQFTQMTKICGSVLVASCFRLFGNTNDFTICTTRLPLRALFSDNKWFHWNLWF